MFYMLSKHISLIYLKIDFQTKIILYIKIYKYVIINNIFEIHSRVLLTLSLMNKLILRYYWSYLWLSLNTEPRLSLNLQLWYQMWWTGNPSVSNAEKSVLWWTESPIFGSRYLTHPRCSCTGKPNDRKLDKSEFIRITQRKEQI